QTFAQRIMFADAPEKMAEDARQKYAEALYKRLTTEDKDVPWMTLPKARAQIEEIVEDRKTNPDTRWKEKSDEQIAELRTYYDRLETRLKTAAFGANDPGNDNASQANKTAQKQNRNPKRGM